MINARQNQGLANVHGSLVQINGRGVLITGISGSGKTSLALGLVETAKQDGGAAFLVSDDQVLIIRANDTVVGKAPLSIAGKVEIYGFGIVPVAHIPSSPIHLVVELVDDRTLERMPESRTQTLCGMKLPMICAPVRHENLAVRIVMANLRSLFD